MLLKQMINTQYRPHFMVVPSLSCPASCRYCFGPNIGPAMDINMVNRVIDFIDSIATETGQSKVRVTLHGGEPLAAGYDIVKSLLSGLHDRFRTIGLDIGMQSNLWLLDEKYCELFKKYGISVSTSLDGPKDINDSQRGDGYFEKTVQGIKLAHIYGFNPSCIATFTSQSFTRWKEVFDFFMSRNIQFSVHPSVATIGKSTGFELSPEQYWKLFNEMFNYYVQNRKNIKIDSYDQLCQGVACSEGRVCTFCDCFGMFLAIDPHGDIYSCQRFAGKKEYRLGNIADNPTMVDLVNSPVGQSFLNREAAIKDKCCSCEHYDYCKGGCPYNAIAKGQSVDPYCEAYKSVFSLIKNRLHEEMVSDENFKAISELGPSERGNPLLRVGPITDLTDEHSHPYIVANTGRKLIAAHELAIAPDIETAAMHLTEMGVFKSHESAGATLNAIKNNMQPMGILNKLYLHVTWNCQLKCKHCYASAGSEAENGAMAIEQIIINTKEAKKCGFKEVVLTGGEPLLHSEIRKLLELLNDIRWEIKPVNIVLRTNFAMPLSIDDYMLLARAFDEIVVSIDGGQKEHDERRGEGAYEKTVNNLEMYSSNIGETIMNGNTRIRSARLSISATMKSQQVNEEPGFAVKALGRRLNIRRVKFRPLLPLGRALDADEPVMSEALRSYVDPSEQIKERFNPVMTCGIGQNLYVEPSGESFPCYSYHKSHSFLGNIIKDGLITIIDSKKFRILQGYTVNTNYGCKTCEYRYLCGGACRAWGCESSQYDLNAAPVECEGLKIRAKKLYDTALEYLQIEY